MKHGETLGRWESRKLWLILEPGWQPVTLYATWLVRKHNLAPCLLVSILNFFDDFWQLCQLSVPFLLCVSHVFTPPSCLITVCFCLTPFLLNSSGRLPIHGDLLEAENCLGHPVHLLYEGGYVIWIIAWKGFCSSKMISGFYHVLSHLFPG